MLPMKHISIEWINLYKQNLITFSNITEMDIRDIWIRKGDIYVDNFSELEYDYDIPLYQKMIFRYRNGNNLATRLFQGCDPCNKRRLLNNFNMIYENTHELIEFFAWISNGLGVYNILEFEKEEISENHMDYVKEWRKNDIEFFFLLSSKVQNQLIQRYNKECIDEYNKMLKKLKN